MSRDSPRLSRLGVLAPAALSACMDASVLAVPAAGAIVSTVLKELSKAFMLKKWYHGIMSAKEAEDLMMEKGRNGSFLVRESQTHPGEYVLSVRVRGRVSHVMIRRHHNKYDVGSGEHFDDLVGLIEHFRLYPMIEASGDVLRLLQPVSGTCVRPKDIKEKVQDMDEVRVIENSGFDDEFQIIKMTEDNKVYTTNEGMKTQNSNKNRYSNILPYDRTRVVLRNTDTDYINANYIRCSRLRNSSSSVQSSTESLNSVSSLIVRSESKQIVPIVTKSLSDDALRDAKKFITVNKVERNKHTVKNKFYIATQGCLPNTVQHFWHMLWQEDVRVIAMITNEIEKGKKKCERYWPLLGTKETFGNMTVKSLSETCYEDYLIREFLVKNNSTSIYRTIYQYQYKNWPDHGTPLEPHGVLALIEDINSRMYQISQRKISPKQNILCVHCSAGVGRTGTFIVLDLLLDKIKMSGFNCEIDVHDTVKLVRSQRYGMVQNKRQYTFINLALQTYVDNNNIKLMKKVHFDNI